MRDCFERAKVCPSGPSATAKAKPKPRAAESQSKPRENTQAKPSATTQDTPNVESAIQPIELAESRDKPPKVKKKQEVVPSTRTLRPRKPRTDLQK